MSLFAKYTFGRVSRSRLAVSWVFFANGAALGSWVPHLPDAKHALALTDGILGFALLAMAAGSLLGLPLSGALTARFGSRATTTVSIPGVARRRKRGRRRRDECPGNRDRRARRPTYHVELSRALQRGRSRRSHGGCAGDERRSW